ncbi:MAG: hypothetical protein JWP72_3795 [Massilia sp.]|nr:hypothetical protein [Massilia sp.]MDB5791981.1 hypothetical protein [Massilia sp.]
MMNRDDGISIFYFTIHPIEFYDESYSNGERCSIDDES